MTSINLLYHVPFPYPESVALFFRNALTDFVRKHRQFSFVSNQEGDINIDIKCRCVDKIKNMEGIKVLVFSDVVWRFQELFDTYEKYYDYVFFLHEDERVDNKRYFYMGAGYDPWEHYYTHRKKTIDVCFLGTKHEGREWIKTIPNIKIYGNGWGDTIPIYHAKKRAIYARTKIMVGAHVKGSSENMRDYETLAQRTFLLSDVIPKCLEGGLILYSGFEDLVKKIEYYLKHEKEREKIAEEGYNKVKKYTYGYRMSQMMEAIKNAKC